MNSKSMYVLEPMRKNIREHLLIEASTFHETESAAGTLFHAELNIGGMQYSYNILLDANGKFVIGKACPYFYIPERLRAYALHQISIMDPINVSLDSVNGYPSITMSEHWLVAYKEINLQPHSDMLANQLSWLKYIQPDKADAYVAECINQHALSCSVFDQFLVQLTDPLDNICRQIEKRMNSAIANENTHGVEDEFPTESADFSNLFDLGNFECYPE